MFKKKVLQLSRYDKLNFIYCFVCFADILAEFCQSGGNKVFSTIFEITRSNKHTHVISLHENKLSKHVRLQILGKI